MSLWSCMFGKKEPQKPRRIGTCSLCGGAVVANYIPTRIIGGTVFVSRDIPETVRCDDCGATPANRHGPTIEMKRQKAKAAQ